MIKHMHRTGGIIFSLLCYCYCTAQTELSVGIGLGYPQMVTNNHTVINAGELSSGLHAGIVYKPDELQFFPGLNLSYGNIWLPLQQGGKDIADLKFNYINVMVNENFAINFPKSQLLIYGGIGFLHLAEKGIPVADRNAKTMQASIDSTANVSKTFPAINIGVEYRVYTDRNFYLGIGINFQYMLLLAGRNTYYITITEPGNNSYNYRASLSGSLVNPGVYVAVHYKVHRKKGSMYL